jgi:lysozyme
MKARHQVSRNAVELIKRFEGYRANAARLADGRWTIGYGHTLTAREGASVSKSDAEALLLYDLIAVAHAVNEHSYTPLNQNQFDALTSFAFNIGVENFRGSSVLRRVNEGALIQAACSMEMWRKADFGGERIVIDALVRRRSAEKHLFLTPPDGWVAAPSPILPPKVDYDASYAVPRQAPAPVTAPLDGDRAEARLDGSPLPVPVRPEEDQAPSASERAAAAVSARLQSLLPEDAPVEAAVAPEADPVVLDVPPMPDPAPVAEVAAEAHAQPSPESEPASPEAGPAPEASDSEVRETWKSEPDAEPLPTDRARPAAWPAPFVAPSLEEQARIEAEAAPVAPQEAPAEPPLIPDLPQTAPLERPAPQETATDADPVEADDGPGLFDTVPAQESAPWTLGASEDRGLVTSFDPAFSLDTKPGSAKAAPLLVLAVVSLVVFAGGVFGGLNAAGDPTGSLLTAKAISWVLCVLGAVGFVAAAYLLLRLIDANDGDS